MATPGEGNTKSLDSLSREERPSEEKYQDGVATDGSGPSGTEPESEPEYLGGLQLTVIMCTINLSTLIASLDLGIVATAIPAITDDFHVLSHVGWYSGACFMLVGTTSAMWGKLYTYMPAKWVYMLSLLIYLVGSIVAAAPPTSSALIAGRAVQGLGCAGTLSGSAIIISFTAHPKHRPMLLGMYMGIFMISTILGPLLGGVFTNQLNWRWCFWINLPVGGVALIMQLFFLRMPEHIKPTPATWKEILLHLDLPGFAIILSLLICYTLALQWGGLAKPWSANKFQLGTDDGSVVATLVMFGVLTVAFFVCEHFQGPYAMIPLRLLKPRIIWLQALYAWLINGSTFLTLFYVPIYFQSIKGTSAITSGVYQLPYLVFYATGSLVSGAAVGATRQLKPFQLAAALISILGAALIYTLDIDSSKAWYFGAQIPAGFGFGLACQIPVMAAQGFSKPKHVAAVTGAILVCQGISGAYFNTAANSILNNRMLNYVVRVAPNLDRQTVLTTGVSEIRQVFAGEDLVSVIHGYMIGIKSVFALAVAGTASSVMVSLLIPFKKLPSHEDKKKEDAKVVVGGKDVAKP